MLKSLAQAGYTKPTPVQAGMIPIALAEDDAIGQARTGTGKTASFAIPIIEQVAYGRKTPGPQALVLVPTRELAVQVRDECAKLGKEHGTRVTAVYGGKPIRQQIEKLKRGTHVVVGTPGRVIDLASRKALLLGDLFCVVLDEADRMLDIGFRPDIEKILRQCPEDRQTLLLSATVPPIILKLAQRYMYRPKLLNFSPKNVSPDTIDQYYFSVEPGDKFRLLVKLIEREDPSQTIVFCRTKIGTEKLHRKLDKKVSSTACIHGDMGQSARDRVMKQFREGKIRILLATDVMGRGIDVTGISHIINYDIPHFSDDYVHRVGRTGRMGREGVAYTFVTSEEGEHLTKIEMNIDKLLIRDRMEGIDPAVQTVVDKPDEASPAPFKSQKRYRRAL